MEGVAKKNYILECLTDICDGGLECKLRGKPAQAQCKRCMCFKCQRGRCQGG